MTYTAWDPGVSSTIPTTLMPLATVFRPENAEMSYEEAKDISKKSGLRLESLFSFNLERMLLHEVMVRVIGDLTILEGDDISGLGVNARTMFATLHSKYIMPEIDSIRKDYESERQSIEDFLVSELDTHIFGVNSDDPSDDPEGRAVSEWARRHDKQDGSALELGCLSGLVSIIGDIVTFRGSLVTDRDLTIKLLTNYVCEDYGSHWLNDRIADLFDAGAKSEGYRFLPGQESPVILNAKGASASGKTSMRPYQREFAKNLDGVEWEDFCYISPDYWRRGLLDYSTLDEENARYGSILTGLEITVVERKLDRHMALRAAAKKTSHMVIDRFRFDNFGVGQSSKSKLLTRFGDRVYMLYMLTSPAATIERAFARGEETGRYEPVDELLFHNVEGYKGISDLFFSWTIGEEKKLHFEFLDNNVPKGSPPRTVAFGWNNKLTVLDVRSMVYIDRYRKVDIEAHSEDELFDEGAMKIEYNLEFIFHCIQRIPEVTFADSTTHQIYLEAKDGAVLWCNHKYIEEHLGDSIEFEAIFNRLNYGEIQNRDNDDKVDVAYEKLATIGSWDA